MQCNGYNLQLGLDRGKTISLLSLLNHRSYSCIVAPNLFPFFFSLLLRWLCGGKSHLDSNWMPLYNPVVQIRNSFMTQNWQIHSL